MRFLKQNFVLIYSSFLILFVELLIIRLIGTEIRIFAYLSNLVLLAAFVGLGIGMIIKQKIPIWITSVSLFTTIIITSANYVVYWPNLEFKLFTGITELLAPLSETYIWLQLNTFSKSGILIGLVLLFLLFINIILIFIPLGQILGEVLKSHKKPVIAYTINIAASFTGLWFFQIYSLSRLTPYFGILIVMFGLIALAKDQNKKIFMFLIALIALVLILPKTEAKEITYWSPYQKLSMSPVVKDESNSLPQPGGWYMEVNNVGYMGLLDLSDKYKKTVEDNLNQNFKSIDLPINLKFSDHYSIPFSFKQNPKEVLIIGAGGGNDVAAAVRYSDSLSKDTESIANTFTIDAIEIDPAILEIGKKFHSEEPYQQKNVNAIVDDGRSFLEKTNKKYDLVIMGLADSHTLSSSLTNLRLDHYLYTKESMQRIKDVLKDDGLLFLSFEAPRPWIGDRLTRGLGEVFGHQPMVFEVRSQGVYGWGGFAFVTAKNQKTINDVLQNNKDLNNFVQQNKREFNTNTKSLTDDWPYLYLDKPRIPILHTIVALVILTALLVVRKKYFGTKVIDWPMFLWGAAFLLFEFQNVSKTSLLFGTTWQTNLFTISAILLWLLAANWVVYKKLMTTKTAFIFLVLSLIILFLTPVRFLSSFSLLPKIIIANLILNVPLFFGGIIFTSMFAKAKNKAHALGSNFLGSVFGGFAEMFSFLIGIHYLLFIVLALYVLGFTIYQRINPLKLLTSR